MKKTALFIIGIFLLLTFSAIGQDDFVKQETIRKNIIKGGFHTYRAEFEMQENTIERLRPLGFAIGYERRINEKTSWAINLVSATQTKWADIINQNITYQISMLSPQFRYYFTNVNMKGLYLGSNLNFGGISVQLGDEKSQGGGSGFGLDLGYQWIGRKHFTAELFFGADFMKIRNMSPSAIGQLYIPKSYSGSKSGIRFGYNF